MATSTPDPNQTQRHEDHKTLPLNAITQHLDSLYPPQYQESWDNAGLLIDTDAPVTGAVTCLDCTPAVVDEALAAGANLVVAHHPLIFGGLKRVTSDSDTGVVIKKLISNKMAFYCAHTNFDSAPGGLNDALADALCLRDVRTLSAQRDQLRKIAVTVPASHAAEVREALYSAGCGRLGRYDRCSFGAEGHGTFRALDGAAPYVGTVGSDHREAEEKIEVVAERRVVPAALAALAAAHPYQEPAVDVFPLDLPHPAAGLGRVGLLPRPMPRAEFLAMLKERLGLQRVLFGDGGPETISKVAVVGGNGSSLLDAARWHRPDAMVTGDIRHHDYHTYRRDFLLADIGHYGGEIVAARVFAQKLREKFPTFAVRVSETEKNPINHI